MNHDNSDSIIPPTELLQFPQRLCYFIHEGGVQILALGIIGEYIGKIYFEVKGRPRYIIEKIKR